MRTILLSAGLLLATPACGTDDPAALAPQLGSGDHSAETVTFTPIAVATDGLLQPRDLAFNPLRPEELWVVNYTDDSVVIVSGASGEARTHEKRIDGYALHFMEQVTALAFGGDETTFGKPGTFGSCGESRNTYNGQAQGNDFTGPTLWSSDLTTFAMSNPNGLGAHLDMLHNTPLCMGIAHEEANRYWVFNGLIGSIERYDFQRDDGIGNDNHGDGLTWSYAKGQVARVANVPSHVVYDAPSGMLYIADTGNARIGQLDTQSGTPGMVVQGFETPIQVMDGAQIETVVGDNLTRPSGLELHDGLLFTTDNGASRILAFDLDGTLVNYVETGLPAGSLGGLTFGPDDKLYVVDMLGNRVLRIDP